MNKNILKDKMKFTIEYSQDELVFLDTKIIATPIVDNKVLITTDLHSKKRNIHTLTMISPQIHVILKIKSKKYTHCSG